LKENRAVGGIRLSCRYRPKKILGMRGYFRKKEKKAREVPREKIKMGGEKRLVKGDEVNQLSAEADRQERKRKLLLEGGKGLEKKGEI